MATPQERFDSLRDILLNEDRADAQQLLDRLNELEKTITQQKKLSKHVHPIIDEKLDEFSESIPKRLGPTITKTLENQIKNSKDQVVEALYPIIGKMIKRYIQNEFKLLSEKISKQINKTFSFKGVQRKVKAFFTGAKESEIILNELSEIEILQVFVIEKNSGIPLGTYSKKDTIDKDLISGMLTAIKSFIEDAFNEKNQALETIEYELYNIHIQNFHTYYIASVISGAFTEKNKDKIENEIIDLAKIINKSGSENNSKKINTILKTHFNNEYR